MGWAKLDDGFHDHPKLIGLSLEALGLWTKCFTWAHRHHGTSPVLGHIPDGLPEMFAGNRGKKLAAELVQHRLWEVESHLGGHVIHDYVDYLPAAEKPQTSREVSEARSKAGKQGAAKRWGKASPSQDDGNLLSPDGKWQIAPTRPDLLATPSDDDVAPADEHIDGNEVAQKRGTRVPEPFTITDPMRDWASEHAPNIDVERSTEKFVNYWRAKTGRDATKRDWLATWRNWLMNDSDRAPQTVRGRESSLARRDQQFLDTDNELARREATRGRTRSEPLALPPVGLRQA